MTTALIYIRQSRHKDHERSVSPEVQERACRALSVVQACDICQTYVDLDKSGKSVKDRPDFRRFLERVQIDPPAVIAVYDQSRTFRNTTEALDFYALMERLPGITVVFHIGHFERSPAGEFTWTTMAAAHTMERKMTGAKISEAKRYAASKGQMVGAVPAGYAWSGTGRARRLIIDEDQAPVIRRIFAEYATGLYSTRDLARRLNAEGVHLPRFTTGWRADTVAQLLGNSAYAGLTYSERRSKRQGQPLRGDWPALVDEGTWQAVQRLLRTRGGHGGRRQQATGQERVYAFQGLLRCVDCGGRLQAQTQTNTVRYYRCRGGGPDCGRGVRDVDVVPWGRSLMEWLEAWQPSELPGQVERELASETPRPPDAVAQIEAALARLGKRFEWGHISEGSYREEWARLGALRDEAARQVHASSPRPLTGLLAGWDTGDPFVQRGLLRTFFAELDVQAGQVIGYRPHQESALEVSRYLEGWRPPFVGARSANSERSPGGIRPDADYPLRTRFA